MNRTGNVRCPEVELRLVIGEERCMTTALFFFQNVKIFVNTSTYEGFPNTFIEAWKNGIPVISLNVNPDDIITAYSLGFCSKTISQMNKDINLLYSDEKLYKKLSNSAYLYVKKNHNLEVIIEEFKRQLYSIVDEGL